MSPDEVTWRELRTVLDEELARLPEKWRLPLILCYLEGRTQDEAAGQLGWSKNTLRRRLDEARSALGSRLSRRGVVWSAALSAALLSDCVASAALPAGLVGATVEAASSLAAGQAAAARAIAVKVAALTEGVLKAMLMTKLKIATSALLAMAVLGTGAGALWTVATAREPVLVAPKANAQEQGKDKEPGSAKTDQQEKNQGNRTALAELDGTWILTEVERAGQPLAAEDVASLRLTWVIKGGKLARTSTATKEQYEVTLKVDAGQQPKTIDVTDKFGTVLGIYVVEGDTLKVCVARGKARRPVQFTSSKDQDAEVLIFKAVGQNEKAKNDENVPAKAEAKRGEGTDGDDETALPAAPPPLQAVANVKD